MVATIKEDQHTEFKSSFGDTAIETLSAFANTSGGKVYIGLDNKGTPVKGFTVGAETLQKWINEVKVKTQPSIIPDINVKQIRGVTIGILSVKEFPVKPVAFKGRYFKRINNSNHQLSAPEIATMHMRSFNASWDSYIDPERTTAFLSLEKVQQFIIRCNTDKQPAITDDPLTILNKFELIKNTQITNAAYLMFARTDVFQATIELGRFSTPTSIKDGITLRTDLFNEVELVLDFIRKHINKSYTISGDPEREERWQYPLPAIREIVINMIVHRDYMDYGDSSVKIYDDHIEFFNPGRLPDSITVEQLLRDDYSSQARNKRIAATFKEAKFIEKYGSGIKRIRESFRDHGLSAPEFENFQHGFRVLVSAAPLTNEGVSEGVSEGVNEGVAILTELIARSPGKRLPYYAEQLNIPRKTVERWLKTLRKEQAIVFKGPPKTGGYWIV